MGWWWLCEVGAPEYLQEGCLSVFVSARGSAAAVVQAGGAAGGAAALTDTERLDAVLV